MGKPRGVHESLHIYTLIREEECPGIGRVATVLIPQVIKRDPQE